MAKVYSVKTWDQIKGEYVNTPHKWTKQSTLVQSGTGEVLLGTEEEVPDDVVNDEGRYNPPGQ